MIIMTALTAEFFEVIKNNEYKKNGKKGMKNKNEK